MDVMERTWTEPDSLEMASQRCWTKCPLIFGGGAQTPDLIHNVERKPRQQVVGVRFERDDAPASYARQFVRHPVEFGKMVQQQRRPGHGSERSGSGPGRRR